jgi:hypothetical protein
LKRISVDHSDLATGAAREHLRDLAEIIAAEVAGHELASETVLSIGNFGTVRMVGDEHHAMDDCLVLRDVEEGSENADRFLARYMTLWGFEHMEETAWSSALECLEFSLKLAPSDPIVIQSMAQVKGELALLAKSDDHATKLLMDMFGDLLKSIELAPDRPNAYIDLKNALQSFRPTEGAIEEHLAWQSEIVRRALAPETHHPQALKARKALARFEAG